MSERRGYPFGILLALCLSESTVTFETSMIFAAMPTLIRTFGDPFWAGQLVAIHPLIAASTAPVVGRLGDLRGRKSVTMILLVLALIGSLAAAFSDSYPVILMGRALQGLSVTVLSLAIGILRENLAPERVPLSIGLLTTAQGVGAAAGLVIGGMIVDHFDWHWLFAASAVLIVMTIVATLFLVPGRKPAGTAYRIDWIEALLPMPGIGALLIAIGMTKRYSLLAPQVVGMAALGLTIIALWIRRAVKAKEPFIDPRLFTIRSFAVSNAVTLVAAAGTMQIIYLFSTYIQSPVWTGVGLGLTATAAGLAKLPSHFITVTAGPLASWQSQRFGHRAATVTSCLLSAAGWAYAILLPNHLLQIIIVLCVTSYGTTMVVTAVANAIVDTVPEDRTSEAIGTMLVTRGVGLALGAQLIAVSLSSDTITAPDGGALFPSAYSYQFTMGWITLTSVIGMAMAMLLPGRHSRKTASPGDTMPGDTTA